ncbi:MAG: NTP transferase domain-containing protein, partial [Thermoanaerobaculia bacterium]
MKRRSGARKSPSRAPAAPSVIVLAAGVGSRMRSALPKVLHRVAGRTLLEAVLDAAHGVGPARVVVVVGAGVGPVEASLEGHGVTRVVQD